LHDGEYILVKIAHHGIEIPMAEEFDGVVPARRDQEERSAAARSVVWKQLVAANRS